MRVSVPKTRPLTLVAFPKRVVYYSKHIDDAGIISEVGASLPCSCSPSNLFQRAFQRIRKRIKAAHVALMTFKTV
jgi:hypothetical protein